MKLLLSTTAFLLTHLLPSLTTASPAPAAVPACGGPLVITSLKWYNGTNNLNCPLNPDPEFLCYTGKPVQPPGYGPPDYVTFNVRNVATAHTSTCNYQNPGSVPAHGEPGRAGLTKCSTGDQTFIFDFVAGKSNGRGGSRTATLTVTDRQTSCGVGSGTFDLSCSVDNGRNSTCVQTAKKLTFKTT